MRPALDPFPYAERAYLYYFKQVGPERVEIFWQLGSGMIVLLLIWLTSETYFQRGLSLKNHWLVSDWTFMPLVALSIVLIRLPGIFSGAQFPGDEEEWMVGAATLIQDPRFWMTVDGHTSGPLVVWPLVLIYYLGGSLSYVWVRLFLALLVLAPAILLVYRAIANALGTRVARLAVLPGLVALSFTNGRGSYAAIPYNGEHIPMLLIALALYLYVLFFIQRTGHFIHLFLLGMVLGLLPYAKLQSVPFGLVLGIWTLVSVCLVRKTRWYHLLLLLSGVMIPTIIVVVYLTVVGGWRDFWWSYLYNNFVYATQGGVGAVRPSFRSALLTTFDYLDWVLSFSWLLEVGRVLLVSLPFLYLLEFRRLSAHHKHLLVLAWMGLVAALEGVIQPLNFFGHYQFLLILPIIFLLGVTLGIFLHAFVAVQRGLFVVIITAFVAYPALVCILQGIEQQPRIGQTDEVSKTIAAYGGPGQKLAVWGYANNLYLRSQMTMGTRNIHTYYQINWDKGPNTYYTQRYISDLQHHRPAVFADAVTPDFETTLSFNKSLLNRRIEKYPPVYEFIRSHYRLVDTVQGVRIFLRNDYTPIRSLQPNSK